ncbi:hypothetical protein EWM64_g9318 [Hericium alpestre]|uniref:Reverse transcriptase domain-containing protein n=1 Tax=Hericium alpestre TaxID=135208 RepID=A0A4Y9ZJR6_9AGAM|nr:hypothetical protein EWM64_g9318 [Hericium alpestre]
MPVDTEPPLAPNRDPIWDVNALLEGNVFTRHTDPFLPECVTRILEEVTIGMSLPDVEWEQVNVLLAEFADCFVLSYLNAKIDKMLEAGIIIQVHPSQVKAVLPTTLVQKAHEGAGLTLQELQHRVNDECEHAGMTPAFELPPQPEGVRPEHQPVAPQKWWICQNFNEIDKVSWLYTAFYVEGRGYFWYICMPFRLTGMPFSFSYMMGQHLYNLLVEDVMELFVNDGGAFADEFGKMMRKLCQIFTRVREHNLSLSASKSSFFMTEAVFAGARVGPDGVLPDLTKLTAIVNWPQPANALNLMSFLGLTGHFRNLIKNYTKVEQPLRDLLQGANLPTPCSKATYRQILQEYTLPEHWTDKHNHTFIGLKAALMSEPVLCGLQ